MGATNYWMQDAFDPKKKGLLHRQLGVSQTTTIPRTFMRDIRATPLGKKCRNPTMRGKRSVKVTRLLKLRVNAVLNAIDSRK